MEKINKIIVSIHLGGKEIELGELVTKDRKIYFRYYPGFIKSGLEISPFRLKAAATLFLAEPDPFDGLYGVFADSLPDGWGRLLLDRTLLSRGILMEDVTPLQRLSYVGTKGMGALIYRPETEGALKKEAKLELDAIAKEMNIVLEGASSDAIEELYQLGGSSGGARPKILVGYNSKTESLLHGVEELPTGYKHWLIKFQSSTDRKDTANIEYAYHKMALGAGIEMSESKLFKGKTGKVYFGTRRFDRVAEKKLHMHSAAGLMHDNFRLSSLDYGHLMDCAFKLERHVHSYEKIIRIAAFNVFAHNRDDHSKNFSFLMDEHGTWKLAPAYDLTFSNSSHGFHSTMIMGESQNPGKADLLKLANHFKVKKAKEIIQQVEEAVSNWKKYAKAAGVEKKASDLIDKRMNEIRKLK
jgi:serine/threonine-protein kinase HipA